LPSRYKTGIRPISTHTLEGKKEETGREEREGMKGNGEEKKMNEGR